MVHAAPCFTTSVKWIITALALPLATELAFIRPQSLASICLRLNMFVFSPVGLRGIYHYWKCIYVFSRGPKRKCKLGDESFRSFLAASGPALYSVILFCTATRSVVPRAKSVLRLAWLLPWVMNVLVPPSMEPKTRSRKGSSAKYTALLGSMFTCSMYGARLCCLQGRARCVLLVVVRDLVPLLQRAWLVEKMQLQVRFVFPRCLGFGSWLMLLSSYVSSAIMRGVELVNIKFHWEVIFQRIGA